MKSVKIGKYELKYPIIQGGMGLGISWDRLAGSVSANGCLGVISSVGTGYYQNLAFVDKQINIFLVGMYLELELPCDNTGLASPVA